MALEEKDVRYVAELAHLELTPEEVEKFLPQLDSILQHMQKLNELDTSRVEPMAQVLYEASEGEGAAGTLRFDRIRPSLPQERAVGNAPEKGAGQFKVPKVIER